MEQIFSFEFVVVLVIVLALDQKIWWPSAEKRHVFALSGAWIEDAVVYDVKAAEPATMSPSWSMYSLWSSMVEWKCVGVWALPLLLMLLLAAAAAATRPAFSSFSCLHHLLCFGQPSIWHCLLQKWTVLQPPQMRRGDPSFLQ